MLNRLLRRRRRVPASPKPARAPMLSAPAVEPGPWRGLHAALREDPCALLVGGTVEGVHPDLYALPVLTEEACRWLSEEARAYGAWAQREGVSLRRPNSMNEYGVMLDDLGLDALATALRERVVAPLAAARFPELGPLDHHHAFIVEYSEFHDRDLMFHVDDSEVTLNLCLGHTFVGGTLYFEGRRCALHRQTGCSATDAFEYVHEPGRALLHAGAHRHGARWLESGHRLNLILWCRSSTHRAALDAEQCPDWCATSRAR